MRTDEQGAHNTGRAASASDALGRQVKVSRASARLLMPPPISLVALWIWPTRQTAALDRARAQAAYEQGAFTLAGGLFSVAG